MKSGACGWTPVEDEVGRLLLDTCRDGRQLGVDVDVDRVGDVLDGRGVVGAKGRLRPDERGGDALEEGLGVDERDPAEGGVRGRLPELLLSLIYGCTTVESEKFADAYFPSSEVRNR
jgi:hypothetical protein